MTDGESHVAITHGTLDVAVASRHAIVVATDSRRSYSDGFVTDDTKKLFALPDNRVVAIAGLIEASLPSFPDITAQIPALLEAAIESSGHLDRFYWDDPSPPANYPEKLRQRWGADPYDWWSSIQGPIQTIYNIAATFASPVDLSRASVEAIVAGYQSTNAPRLDRLRLHPQEGLSSWGRRFVGASRSCERIPVEGFAAVTIGAKRLADSLLDGDVPADFRADLPSFPGIEAFLCRRAAGVTAEMSSAELCSLAHDLIRATATRCRGVGSEPLQTAILRVGQTAVYDQPVISPGTIVLPADGTWHMGVVFTPDYPFATQRRGAVFTDCVVADNRSPIPLAHNLFFGSRFIDAIFYYDDGPVMFGPNNQLTNCELRLPTASPATGSTPIHHLFSKVVRA